MLYAQPTPFHRWVTEKPSNIWGLTYIPTTEPHYRDNIDYFNITQKLAKGTLFSRCNLDVLSKQITDEVGCVLELGMNKRGPKHFNSCSTVVILRNKKPSCLYLGVDLHNKRYVNNVNNNAHTIQCNTFDRAVVRDKLTELGAEKIDVLMIDADHSINSAINDWRYTEWLSDSGVVVLHDTNAHIGPTLLYDAIDSRLFDKQKFCKERNKKGIFTDWGVAVFKRKNES